MKQVLDLFSGIGGFSLGLERTGGFETAAFCEIDPYARAVLNKHWPEVPCYEDVRTLTADRLGADGIAVDVICGGFPCQDISTAGKGAGLAGERSGLWSEIARLVGELRPSYVIVENVSALLGRGLSRVLGDLSEIGYDAQGPRLDRGPPRAVSARWRATSQRTWRKELRRIWRRLWPGRCGLPRPQATRGVQAWIAKESRENTILDWELRPECGQQHQREIGRTRRGWREQKPTRTAQNARGRIN